MQTKQKYISNSVNKEVKAHIIKVRESKKQAKSIKVTWLSKFSFLFTSL